MRTVFLAIGVCWAMVACDSATSEPKVEQDQSAPLQDVAGQDSLAREDTIPVEDLSKPDPDIAVTPDVPAPEDLVLDPDLNAPDVADVTPQDLTPADVPSPDLLDAIEETAEVVCVPDCQGKLCGDDGCLGQCGVCDENQVCDAVTWTCVSPTPPVVTFIDQMFMPEKNSDTPCCFDLNDDGDIDNSAAGLVDLLGSFVPDMDVNQLLADAIWSGQLAILLEFVGVSGWANATEFTMNAYLATDADSDYSDNLDSTNGGEFLLLPDSLDDQGMPLIVFQDMSLSAGTLHGGPSMFIVQLPLFGPTPMTLILDNAMIEGTLSVVNGDKASISQGKLGGVVRKAVIVEALNGFVDSSCSCLGLGQPLIDPATDKCATGGSSAACDEPCASLYSYCSLATMMFGTILDIDLDQDGITDSMSIGLQFQSIPAKIVGNSW